MFCPQCGQQQASEEMRFCSRCGFPLGDIAEVLARGGVLAPRDAESQGRKMSARQKGIRQGAMLMLSTVLIVPLIIFAILLFHVDQLIPLIPFAAVVCFVGGFIRIAYALMFEDAVPPAAIDAPAMPFAPAQLNAPVRGTMLPPAQGDELVSPATAWRRRTQTSEIVQPPSVTENTTKLFEKEGEKQG
jgi:hypothetical protein